MESKDREENWCIVTKQVQVDDQSTHPSIHQSFVASGRCIEPDAPAFWEKCKQQTSWKRRGAHTHTLSHRVFSVKTHSEMDEGNARR